MVLVLLIRLSHVNRGAVYRNAWECRMVIAGLRVKGVRDSLGGKTL